MSKYSTFRNFDWRPAEHFNWDQIEIEFEENNKIEYKLCDKNLCDENLNNGIELYNKKLKGKDLKGEDFFILIPDLLFIIYDFVSPCLVRCIILKGLNGVREDYGEKELTVPLKLYECESNYYDLFCESHTLLCAGCNVRSRKEVIGYGDVYHNKCNRCKKSFCSLCFKDYNCKKCYTILVNTKGTIERQLLLNKWS